MRISKYIHSCLLVEDGGDRILFDPGKFSFIEGKVRPDQFRDVKAVLITHGHPDHLDEGALAEIVKRNPTAVIFSNAEVQTKLAASGIAVTLFETGTRRIGNFEVTAAEAQHAPILGSAVPRNTAYLLNRTLLNPGDSFAESLSVFAGTRVLALPVTAPWCTEPQVAAFADRMRPQEIVPVHDGYLKEFFLEQRYANYAAYFSKENVRFCAMGKPGDGIEV